MKTRFYGVALALLVTLLGAGSSAAGSASKAAAVVAPRCDGSTGAWEICMHSPGAGSDIIRRLTELVEETEAGPGAQIRLNNGNFGYASASIAGPEIALAQALVDADERGVDVKVLLDSAAQGSNIDSLLQQHGLLVRLCAGGKSCIPGDNVIAGRAYVDHAKFMTFKSVSPVTGAVTYKSMVTSTNFVPAQRLNRYQNLAVNHGDQTLFDTLNGYWASLSAGAWSTAWNTAAKRIRDGVGWNFIAMPQDSDPLAKWIRGVTSCTSAHQRIYLPMSLFEADERPAVGAALEHARKTLGCNTRVITQTQAACSELANYISASRIAIAPVHDKVLVIDAYKNGAAFKAVWTGSANAVKDSMQGNDDLMLKIDDDAVADRHLSRFESIWRQATPCAP